MSSVSDLGTIRNTIRGVDEPPLHTLLCEMIDDAEHSNSRKVFLDINTRDKYVVFGFENAATGEQLNKIVEWNPVSQCHGSSKISTCGQGLKFYEFRFRGEHIHVSKTTDESTNKDIYRKSSLNSDLIYQAASNPDVSETEFSVILKKNTHYVEETDEIIQSMATIFSNDENKYPFTPKTVILSKKINNAKLLDWLNEIGECNEDSSLKTFPNIINLEKDLINKYFKEIKENNLKIYIKFPMDTEFKLLGDNSVTDVIGATLRHKDEHIIEIFHVERDFSQAKKGEYLIQVNDLFFKINKSGTSYTRKHVTIHNDELSNMFHAFSFLQYTNTEDESLLKKAINGSSLDEYCGIYLEIGDKFIDSRPITANITKRNLPGAKLYRGILKMRTPQKTKMMLGIQGLKSNFNLSSMQQLETIIKQSCIIYNNFYKKFPSNHNDFRSIDPKKYCVVETSNQKTKRTSTPGVMYVRVVGKNFYKLGMTKSTDRMERIFKKQAATEIEELRTAFNDEEIYEADKQYHIYLSPVFDKCGSTEQNLKEMIVQMEDVTSYDSRSGNDIREYFHCDNLETINEIIKYMIENL